MQPEPQPPVAQRQRNVTVLMNSSDSSSGPATAPVLHHTKRVQSFGRTRGEAIASDLRKQVLIRQTQSKHKRRPVILGVDKSEVFLLGASVEEDDDESKHQRVLSFSNSEFDQEHDVASSRQQVVKATTDLADSEVAAVNAVEMIDLKVNVNAEVIRNAPGDDHSDDDNDNQIEVGREEIFTPELGGPPPSVLGVETQPEPSCCCSEWRAWLSPWFPMAIMSIICSVCRVPYGLVALTSISLILSYISLQLNRGSRRLFVHVGAACYYITLQVALLVLAEGMGVIIDLNCIQWLNVLFGMSALGHALMSLQFWLEGFVKRSEIQDLP